MRHAVVQLETRKAFAAMPAGDLTATVVDLKAKLDAAHKSKVSRAERHSVGSLIRPFLFHAIG